MPRPPSLDGRGSDIKVSKKRDAIQLDLTAPCCKLTTSDTTTILAHLARSWTRFTSSGPRRRIPAVIMSRSVMCSDSRSAALFGREPQIHPPRQAGDRAFPVCVMVYAPDGAAAISDAIHVSMAKPPGKAGGLGSDMRLLALFGNWRRSSPLFRPRGFLMAQSGRVVRPPRFRSGSSKPSRNLQIFRDHG